VTDFTIKIKRQTAAKIRGNPLVVELTPFDVTIREKGTQRGYTVPWMAVYELGTRLKAREDERERKIDKAIKRSR
jgi:hypothetical protein